MWIAIVFDVNEWRISKMKPILDKPPETFRKGICDYCKRGFHTKHLPEFIKPDGSVWTCECPNHE